jgi:putative transposase
MLTYKYRLYPNKEQVSLLWKHANKCNWLYNYFLNQRIEVYKNTGKGVSKKQQQKELVNLKENDSAIREIHSQVLQQITLRIDETYKAFFKRNKEGQGFPKFRSCKKFFGIRYPQSGFSIQDDVFHTKIYGDIKFYKHRSYQGNIKQVMLICDKDKWFLCITTDFDIQKTEQKKKESIDVGITNLYATSSGEIVKNKTHAKYFDREINKLKSRRDKQCKKYSREWKNLSRIINRLYEMKGNKVRDYLHKKSQNLSCKYDTVFCEDLSLKEMSESERTGLNRELRNSQLGTFINYLQYKTNIVKVNPRNTTKTCYQCGSIQDMPLWNRTYKCKCGYKEDRDVNAAKNIFCLGQAIISGLCTESSMIQEALPYKEVLCG